MFTEWRALMLRGLPALSAFRGLWALSAFRRLPALGAFRGLWALSAFAGVLALSACGAGGPASPVVADGWDTYGYASHITCGTRPVLLNGDRTDLTADGPCSRVTVAGDHNDVSITLLPGGTIDITGDHNDVTWQFPPGLRGAPVLLDHGHSNTYHTGT